ncbi:hypothetical protein TrRE_jg5845 [Triparma retinervis]|uniref:non-specific serine/threonine protein kinase n=1 Tax=Triparma retinervis TaxID=2557542 RepID=A0A9W7F5I5_9STRA|nr:hypothetical protein TrRE_jg5845 [Triparma retinervis]
MAARSTLSDFKVEGKLGSGSFGTVYRAYRLKDGLSYVIKTIQIGELTHTEQLEAINEVKLLASIQSPYVVKYFDSFVENETLYIVMEYCNRGDLKGLLKRRNSKKDTHLESNRCWSLMLQMMLGLYDIHCQKVLHRDMKTANVFLTANPDPDSGPRYFVKIGDLGVAKLLGTSTAFANTVVGTPYYLSPELCEDKPYNDKSDVWALGVILYECLTFKHPFEARNQCALILKIIKGKFTPISDDHPADENLKKIVSMCLTHDCAKRPSISDLLSLNYVQDMIDQHDLDLPEKIVRVKKVVGAEGLKPEQEKPPSTPLSSRLSSQQSSPSSAVLHAPTDTPKVKNLPKNGNKGHAHSRSPATPKALNPKPPTPNKYDRKRIITGAPSRNNQQHENSTPSKSAAVTPSSFSVNGVGAVKAGAGKPLDVLPRKGNTAGIRGNRVRGGQRNVSAIAQTRHQKLEAKPSARSNTYMKPTSNRSSYAKAQHSHHQQAEQKSSGGPGGNANLGDLMTVNGHPSTTDLHEAQAPPPPRHSKVGVVRVKPAPTRPPLRHKRVDQQDEDDFLSESKLAALHPSDDFDAKDASLPSTVNGEDAEGEDIVESDFAAVPKSGDGNGGDDDGARVLTPQPTRIELIGNMQKYVSDLDKLVSRARKQCRKMLGTAFDELHTLFKERFIDDEGSMMPDSNHSEEKTEEMHLAVESMQDDIVERCGGVLEACSAVFNVQRLLALEAGLVEAERNLARAMAGEEIKTGVFGTPRGYGVDDEETEGEEEEEVDENADYYEDDSFEEFVEEGKE